MIPIKNKKKSFEDTVQEMRDFSMKYIEKYAPSKQQLRTHLLKKYLKFGAVGIKKNEIKDLIDVVLSDLENSKYLNDKFYSNSKAKNLIQRGSSINKIRNYLMSKGINQKFVKETLDKIKEKGTFIAYDGLSINTDTYVVKIDGNELTLPRKEFELLAFFMNQPDTVFSRESLLSSIWEDDVYVVDRTIDVHINRIRSKLMDYKNWIETVKGVGYRFRPIKN